MSDEILNQKKIKCPRCGHLTVLSSENPYRPFCSERCKLIDLGQWASESYKVPVEEDFPSVMDDDSSEFH